MAGGGWVFGQSPRRGKNPGLVPPTEEVGHEKSLAVEGAGGPLGVVIAGANVPDVQLLEQTLEAIVIDRPEVTQEEPQHLCLDKGYDQPLGHKVVAQTDYTPQSRLLKEKEDLRGFVWFERALKVGPFRYSLPSQAY